MTPTQLKPLRLTRRPAVAAVVLALLIAAFLATWAMTQTGTAGAAEQDAAPPGPGAEPSAGASGSSPTTTISATVNLLGGGVNAVLQNGRTFRPVAGQGQHDAGISGLTSGTQYELQARHEPIADSVFYIPSDWGPASPETATPVESTVLANPGSVTAYALSSSTAEVTWATVDNAVGYDILTTRAGVEVSTVTVQGFRTHRATITGLGADTEYEFAVKPVGDGITYTSNITGTKSASPITTYDNDDLTLTGDKFRNIKAEWDAAANTPYQIDYRVVGADDWTADTNTLADEWTITDTNGVDVYEVRVTPTLELMEDDFSNSIYAASRALPDAEQMAAPSGMTVAAEPGKLLVATDAKADKGDLADVRYREKGDGDWIVAVGVARHLHTIDGLHNGTTYQVQARSHPSAGNLYYLVSDWAPSTEVEATPRLNKLTAPEVEVWSRYSDEIRVNRRTGSIGAASYVISLAEADSTSTCDKAAESVTLTGNEHLAVFTGLSQSTEYEVCVQAKAPEASLDYADSDVTELAETVTTPTAYTLLDAEGRIPWDTNVGTSNVFTLTNNHSVAKAVVRANYSGDTGKVDNRDHDGSDDVTGQAACRATFPSGTIAKGMYHLQQVQLTGCQAGSVTIKIHPAGDSSDVLASYTVAVSN